MTQDMLTGKPLKSIIKFTIPIFIGNICQQLYSMVDTMIVGKTLSTEALAGVGATAAIVMLIIGLISGLTAGFSVVTSQCFGANDRDAIKRSIVISYILSFVLAIVVTVVLVATVNPMLKIMKTPDNVYQYSKDYILVMYYGVAATMLYNLVSNLLRALGDSKTPLYFLIIASILNFALDLLFIMVFKMGVKGAAWATVLSQALSGIACVLYMVKKYPMYRVTKKDFKMTHRFVMRHIANGGPMSFQYSVIGIGIMVQQAAINSFGSNPIAAYTAAAKIDAIAVQILFSLGTALAVYCGQNYGANNIQRIKKGVNDTALFSVGAAIAAGCFVIFLAKPLTSLFMQEPSAEIYDYSQKFLFYQGVFYIMLAGIFVYRSSLQGMGYSMLTIIACIIELGMRILASIFLSKMIGWTGISLSNPVAWIGATIFLVVAYYIIISKKLRVKEPPMLGSSFADIK